MRIAEAALSGRAGTNTGDDLTRRMEAHAAAPAPGGRAPTQTRAPAPQDDEEEEKRGALGSAKGALKTGATMAK